jgi:hypothetical protein
VFIALLVALVGFGREVSSLAVDKILAGDLDRLLLFADGGEDLYVIE